VAMLEQHTVVAVILIQPTNAPRGAFVLVVVVAH
jgi:hypothetical protein